MSAQALIRSTIVAFLAFAASLAFRTSAGAERQLPAVAYTGQTAGGTASPFLTLDGAPVTNATGDVAFRALVGTAQAFTRGLWRASAATGLVEAVALQGLPAPVPGDNKFSSFGLPFLLPGGEVLFAADIQGTTLFDAVFLASAIDDASLAVAASALGASTRIDGVSCPNNAFMAQSAVLANDNKRDGISAKGVTLEGDGHEASRNAFEGIKSFAGVQIHGSAAVNQNGSARSESTCRLSKVGGIVATGSITTGDITAMDNCGSGLRSESGSVETGVATITGNRQSGIWSPAGAVVLHGGGHDISLNRLDGIHGPAGMLGTLVRIEGAARIHGNGMGYEPSACRNELVGGLTTDGDVIAGDLDLEGNCGSGIVAQGIRAGNVRAVNNSRFGVRGRSAHDVVFTGEAHEISGNGQGGVSALSAAVRISGRVVVHANGLLRDAIDCEGFSVETGGIVARSFTGDDVEVRGNCGSGIAASGLVELRTAARAIENTQHGIYSFSGPLLLKGTGHVIFKNGLDGLHVAGGSVAISGSGAVNENERDGIAASSEVLPMLCPRVGGPGVFRLQGARPMRAARSGESAAALISASRGRSILAIERHRRFFMGPRVWLRLHALCGAFLVGFLTIIPWTEALRSQDCDPGAQAFALAHDLRFPTGNNPVDVAALDVNQDGLLDLVSANEDGSALSVLMGNGDGTFDAPEPAGEGEGANAVRTADFDQDGSLDLVVASRRSASFHVLLTRLGGGLSLRGPFSLNSNVAPRAISVVSLNGDEWPDLLVSFQNSRAVSVLTGSERVFFTEVEAPLLADYCGQIVAADLDHDGFMDFAGSQCSPPGILLVRGKPEGGFESARFVELSNVPSSMIASDLDKDGYIDLVIAIARSESLAVLRGNTGGELSAPVEWKVGGAVWRLELLDLSGDNVLDLVGAGDSQVIILEGAGNGVFRQPRAYSFGQGGLGMATGDFNRDGLVDVATTSGENGDFLSVMLNSGGGQLGAVSRIHLASEPVSAAAGDMDGDGLADLVISTRSLDQLQIHLNRGKRRFERSWETRASPSSGLAAGDFNGDGNLDVVKTAENAQWFDVFPGNGHGALGAPVSPMQFTESGGPHAFLVVNGDGDANADVASIADGRVALFSRFAGEAFQERINFLAQDGARRGAAGDLNRDGVLDFVTGNEGGNFAVLLGRIGGGFEAPVTYSDCNGAVWVALGDFNGDQFLDVIASCENTEAVTLRRGGPSGALSEPRAFPADREVNGLVAEDLDGDGNLDVAMISAATGRLTVLLGAGDGTLVPAEQFPVGEFPVDLRAADLDGDGAVDLQVLSQRPSASTGDLLIVWNDSLRVGRDCNQNGQSDACDLRLGFSRDLDHDGFLDECQTGLQVPGDCNQDGAFNISDAICILGVLFTAQPDRFACGDGSPSAPANLKLLDAQSDDRLNLADAVSILAFLFQGGPSPDYRGGDAAPAESDCLPAFGCPDGPGCR